PGLPESTDEIKSGLAALAASLAYQPRLNFNNQSPMLQGPPMTPRIKLLLLATLTLTPIARSAEAPTDLPKQLIEGTSSAKTPAEFEAAYTQVLPPLITKPETSDTVLQKLSFHASRPGAE